MQDQGRKGTGNGFGVVGYSRYEESRIAQGMCPIAAGLGLSIQYKNEDKVVLCFFGDGATNQGAYHEALNMASLYKLPIVRVCENNQYAIGISLARSSAQESLVEKAKAYLAGVSPARLAHRYAGDSCRIDP
ncbi:thiamine pyrophosphate-dependent enzyme [Planctomycetota bacterium]